MADEYVDAVRDCPTPTTTMQVEQFLGFANYHRNFIRHFADIAYPLHKFTGKKPFKWEKAEEKDFTSLKNALMITPVLTLPNVNDPFILDTDAPNFAIGAKLVPVQNGIEITIAYSSFTLIPEQLNFCTTRKDLLAVVRFTRHYRHYVLCREFTVRTYHSCLTWMLNFREPQGQLAR